jgi:hypothetical protein
MLYAPLDDDKSRLPVLRGTKISSSDPVLMTIRTAYVTPPFLPVLHPPVDLASFRPGSRLHLDGRVNFAAIRCATLL